MSIADITQSIDTVIQKQGFDIIPFSQAVAEAPELSFLLKPETSWRGFSGLGDKRIFVNDSDPQDEQLFTILHEMGHQLSGSQSEDVADNIALFCCQLIRSLTGIDLAAE